MESTGIDYLVVHGRSRAEFYQGKADWEEIARIKAALSIPVVGNGDIFNGKIAMDRLRESKVDGLMIGRGAEGNPWIFQRIHRELQGKVWTPPTPGGTHSGGKAPLAWTGRPQRGTDGRLGNAQTFRLVFKGLPLCDGISGQVLRGDNAGGYGGFV